MIKSLADKRTQALYVDGCAKRFPPELAVRAIRKLEYVALATDVDDLRVPPGNRLRALTGDRKGQYAIAVNDQWRICFLTDTSRPFTTVEVRDVQSPADVAIPKQFDGTAAKRQYESRDSSAM